MLALNHLLLETLFAGQSLRVVAFSMKVNLIGSGQVLLNFITKFLHIILDI